MYNNLAARAWEAGVGTANMAKEPAEEPAKVEPLGRPAPKWDGPIVGDGVSDASGIGPPRPSEHTLLNRLPRQHSAAFPPIADQRLPPIDPHATDIAPEHHKKMVQELGKRMAAQGGTLNVRIPPDHPRAEYKPPNSESSKDWVRDHLTGHSPPWMPGGSLAPPTGPVPLASDYVW
jgi:hypothetical protein